MVRKKIGVLLSSLVLAVVAIVGIGSALAEVDPDHNSSRPTGWHWWMNITEADVNAKRKNSRLVDIERSWSTAGRFNAIFVDNRGLYERQHEWWFGQNGDQVVSKINGFKGRITDMEVHSVGGQRRFAFSMVKNTGAAAKAWWWGYDLTPEQIAADIDTNKMRLVDLEAYKVGNRTVFAYVGISNQGPDAKGWWWYLNVTPQYLADRIKENQGRLIDIEVHENGNLSAVMIRNDGTPWWWGAGLGLEALGEAAALTASRFIDIEEIRVGSRSHYAYISIDNANEETKRLRGLISLAYDKPHFGDKVIRGFYVKQVQGPVIADLAGGLRFQPLSTLKLLPYRYAFEEIDNGNAKLGTNVSWTEKPGEPYVGCLKAGAAGTQKGTAPLAFLLPTMMWESHGRSLDALLDLYHPTNITKKAQEEFSMPNTEMHFGCQQPGGPAAPWAANRSTLHDLGAMFESVDTISTIDQDVTRTEFLNRMITLDYNGTDYYSPITNKTTGPFNNGFLRGIVMQEAGPSKQAIVEPFLQRVVLHGKGGSGGPSGDDTGFVDFLHVTLPFKESGKIVDKTFVMGWFFNRMKAPDTCPDPNAKDAFWFVCDPIWDDENSARENFKVEIHRAAIRKALATW